MPRKEYVLRSELFVKVGYFSFMPRTEYGLKSEVGGGVGYFSFLEGVFSCQEQNMV